MWHLAWLYFLLAVDLTMLWQIWSKSRQHLEKLDQTPESIESEPR